MIVLSCSTRSFPDMPLERSLARIAWAGFRSVELCLPPSAPLPEPSSLQDVLQTEDLTVAAVDAGTLGGEDLTPALEAAAHVGRCAVMAQSLQSNRVVCDLALASEPLAREVVGQLLGALSPLPVLLCLRNGIEEGAQARELLFDLIGSHLDRMGLALDPGAACRTGWDVLGEWDLLVPLLRHVYATDGNRWTAAGLGAGEVPWNALATRLRSSDYSGAVSLRIEGPEAFHDPLFAEAELKEARFLMESWFHGAG